MKQFFSRAILSAAILTMVFAGAASAGTLEDILQRGELRVASQSQGPPFSFVDKNGERAGSSVELCELMAKEMGVKIKFLNYDWDGLIPALLSKKADILAADMTPTLARAMKIGFTTRCETFQYFRVSRDFAYEMIDILLLMTCQRNMNH